MSIRLLYPYHICCFRHFHWTKLCFCRKTGQSVVNCYLLGHLTVFVQCGPAADTGLTGRKIIADTYGGYAHHGGGSFSGKDPTKVDRSAAYIARFIAKNIVAANLAATCEVQLSYTIGVAEPTSVSVDTYGTGKIPDSDLCEIIRECYDLTPAGIIQSLNLRKPIYSLTSVYGHFGKPEWELPWEKISGLHMLIQKAQKYIVA